MGRLIRERGLTPDLIISSDAVRARLTAAAVAETAQYAGEIRLEPRLYGASVDEILAVLVRGEECKTVMIVGHNPGLEEIVALMTGEPHDFPTAALAQIALPIDRWRDLSDSTRGKLLGLWRPKELK